MTPGAVVFLLWCIAASTVINVALWHGIRAYVRRLDALERTVEGLVDRAARFDRAMMSAPVRVRIT